MANDICPHSWVSASYALLSLPPQTPQICAMCGEKRTLSGYITTGPSYDELVLKFKEKNDKDIGSSTKES